MCVPVISFVSSVVLNRAASGACNKADVCCITEVLGMSLCVLMANGVVNGSMGKESYNHSKKTEYLTFLSKYFFK